jgi:hypothetical protein
MMIRVILRLMPNCNTVISNRRASLYISVFVCFLMIGYYGLTAMVRLKPGGRRKGVELSRFGMIHRNSEMFKDLSHCFLKARHNVCFIVVYCAGLPTNLKWC